MLFPRIPAIAQHCVRSPHPVRKISSSRPLSTHQLGNDGPGLETWATIERLKQLSPSTTELRLRLDERANGNDVTFFPGQWVDFFIPGLSHIGGYSIISLPSELPWLDLAVKASAHPAAFWCTSRAKVGDRVAVRVGGEFGRTLCDATNSLFIAGGVGINPLYSMLRELSEGRRLSDQADRGRMALLYTARSRDELLFVDQLESFARALPDSLRICFHVTREPIDTVDASCGMCGYIGRRLDETDLEVALRWLGCEPCEVQQGVPGVPWRSDSKRRIPDTASPGCCAAQLGAFVCGPPQMTNETVTTLRRMGVTEVAIEKWW